MGRRWRNWAFESAGLDLALNQAGRALHEVVEREPRPLRFVNSLGLGDPPTFDPIRRRLAHHPGLRFKLDVTPAWTPELMEAVAATGAVEIVDFKGQYGLEMGDLPELLAMYERAVAAFPDALLEDAHDLPEVAKLLEDEAHRISYDAPIHTVEDLDSTPLKPRAVNIKPCRVGGVIGANGPTAGIPVESVLALGTEDYEGGDPAVFNMAVMGLRLSQRANGVSELHGDVSRGMFDGLWPGFDEAEVPIASITNGVHAPTWVAREVIELAASRGADPDGDDVDAFSTRSTRCPARDLGGQARAARAPGPGRPPPAARRLAQARHRQGRARLDRQRARPGRR